jgi:hypothetical protein
MAEKGATGLPLFNGRLSLDQNPKLRGRQGTKVFQEMRSDEPAARAFLNAAGSLLRTDLGVEPGGPKRADKQAAVFLEACLADMDIPQALRQMHAILWAGWSFHEVVYTRRDDGRVGWAKWALRRQETLERWEVKAGEIDALVQRPAPDYQLRTIPLNRAIHIVADDSEGSPEGFSPLRGMYRQWFFVKNLELLLGIALERFGTGVPVFEAGEGVGTLTAADEAALQAAISGLKQNEEAGVITPRGFTFRFADSPGLSATDYLEVIRYMRVAMLSTVLADFIALGTGVTGGAYALGKDKSELFLLALNSVQDRILDAINRQAVRRLFLNANAGAFGKLTALPKLVLPPVKRYDLAGLGTFAELLERIGAFHPTPEDEEFFRKVSDLPDKDLAELRELHERAPQPVPGPVNEAEPEAPAPETNKDEGEEEEMPMMEEGR